MPDYIFSLGLIPVQSWIQEARRSRDLRTGSVFLWWVMAKMLAHLEKHGEIVVPKPPPGKSFSELAASSFSQALHEEYGIPNRATGYLVAQDDEAVRKLFDGLKTEELIPAWAGLKFKECQQPLETIGSYQDFWKELKLHWMSYQAKAKDGKDCPFSLVWGAKRIEGQHRLKEDMTAIDHLYMDVKRSRPVAPWPFVAPVGKCNQCGRREAMGPEDSFPAWQDWHQKIADLEWVKRGVRIDPGERLCYICFTKRMAGYGGKKPEFASTGLVAARLWIEAIENLAEIQPSFQALRDAVKAVDPVGGGGDLGRALYRSEARLMSDGLETVAKARKDLRQAIKVYNDKLKRRKETEHNRKKDRLLPLQPPSYLALMTFDGDDMGSWVRKDPNHVPNEMNGFAGRAHEILKGASAGIFYLAGDEGLTMLPAVMALPTALELEKAFGQVFERETGKEAPTPSMGLAFFAHDRPMANAMKAARWVLEQAKALNGKHALGVAVEMGSGNRWHFVEHWGTVWERLSQLVSLVHTGHLASGWAYDVERFLETLPEEAWRSSEGREAIRAEMERLFVRRLTLPKTNGALTPKQRLERKRALWRELHGDTWWESTRFGQTVEPAPQQFHLLAFLARQALASPTPEHQEVTPNADT